MSPTISDLDHELARIARSIAASRAQMLRIARRIDDDAEERHQRLVRHALAEGIVISSDISIDIYAARHPQRPHEVELVTRTRCTCHRFRLWHVCEHHALLHQLLESGDLA